MSQPYLGEIRMFAGNFAPRNNALCNGQFLAIAQNTALFSLFGTFYGGNGTVTFALPDLRGRLPISQGQGLGLTDRIIGEQDGTETVTLLSTEMPMHNHSLSVSDAAATSAVPTGLVPGKLASPWLKYWVADADKTGSPIAMSPASLTVRGGSQPHENRMPAMAISMIVSLSGIFPSRN